LFTLCAIIHDLCHKILIINAPIDDLIRDRQMRPLELSTFAFCLFLKIINGFDFRPKIKKRWTNDINSRRF